MRLRVKILLLILSVVIILIIVWFALNDCQKCYLTHLWTIGACDGVCLSIPSQTDDGEEALVQKTVVLSGVIVNGKDQKPIENALIRVSQQWVSESLSLDDISIWEETYSNFNGEYRIDIPIYSAENLESSFNVTACKERFSCASEQIIFGISDSKVLNLELEPAERIDLIGNYTGNGRFRLEGLEREKAGAKIFIATNTKDDPIWEDLERFEDSFYVELKFGGTYYLSDNNVGYIELDYVDELQDE